MSETIEYIIFQPWEKNQVTTDYFLILYYTNWQIGDRSHLKWLDLYD